MLGQVFAIGAGGDLGARVVRELRRQAGQVRCLVRSPTSSPRRALLLSLRAEVREVDFRDKSDMTRVCEGGTVVLSAVSGLREVVIDLHSSLLRPAVAGGVLRFIPSDFAVDVHPPRLQAHPLLGRS